MRLPLGSKIEDQPRPCPTSVLDDLRPVMGDGLDGSRDRMSFRIVGLPVRDGRERALTHLVDRDARRDEAIRLEEEDQLVAERDEEIGEIEALDVELARLAAGDRALDTREQGREGRR